MAQGNFRERLEALESQFAGLEEGRKVPRHQDGDVRRQQLPRQADPVIALGTDLIDLGSVPSCALHKTSDQAIGTGAWTKVTFGTITHDTDQMADIANNGITIRRAGLYLITCTIPWEAVAAGTVRGARIMVETADIGRDTTSGHGLINPSNSVSRRRYCGTGTRITASVYHDRGANLNVFGSTATLPGPALEATLIADIGGVGTEMA